MRFMRSTTFTVDDFMLRAACCVISCFNQVRIP